jgi:CheY-like chemotaxis protein
VIPSLGEDADVLHKIAQHRPDVVILDYQLPGMTGVEIAHQIRQETMSELRIVAMTAASRAEQVCAQMQADSCLAKPFSVDELLLAVQQAAHQGHHLGS